MLRLRRGWGCPALFALRPGEAAGRGPEVGEQIDAGERREEKRTPEDGEVGRSMVQTAPAPITSTPKQTIATAIPR